MRSVLRALLCALVIPFLGCGSEGAKVEPQELEKAQTRDQDEANQAERAMQKDAKKKR